MSLFKKIGAALGITKPVIAAAEAFALTEMQKAINALKKTEVGAAVAADIRALTSSALTGPQKFEQVVANTLPLVAALATKGGTDVAVNEAEDLARALVQDVFNEIASTRAFSIASLVLRALGFA